MLVVYIGPERFSYELSLLFELFAAKADIVISDTKEAFFERFGIEDFGLMLEPAGEQIKITAGHFDQTESSLISAENTEVKRRVYEALEQAYAPRSPWGILVGVRPVKIVHEMLDQGLMMTDIRKALAETYHIQTDKIDLLTEVALRERPHLYPVEDKAVSLYLCIPFCPTRCSYCSFPSNDLAKKGKHLPDYLDHLIEELYFSVNQIRRAGKYVDCVYIGGGTPTTLSAEQMERLLKAADEALSGFKIKEFTVEAGRPDTITREKLEVMKRHGVDRICVNPQTMNPETLDRIGRRHSPEDIEKVMHLVKTIGFKTVNMDLIMGLPGETLEDAVYTTNRILELAPESVTLHTLAIKRAARLNREASDDERESDGRVEAMLNAADTLLRHHGITPYYMYRQKKMLGNLENVGYAKPGHASLYNMRMMEERHTIVALGAGAVSKICFPEENRHERVANFKGLEDYLNRFDEILEKKKEI